MIYGKKLKELRINDKKVQNDIAKILNISKSQYCNYECEYEVIPLKHLNCLCNYYKISFDYVFGFSDKKYKMIIENIDIAKFSERIKLLRKELGLSQKWFGFDFGLSDTTISSYEKGKTLISTLYLYYICKKYGISADYLLGKIDEPMYFDDNGRRNV